MFLFFMHTGFYTFTGGVWQIFQCGRLSLWGSFCGVFVPINRKIPWSKLRFRLFVAHTWSSAGFIAFDTGRDPPSTGVRDGHSPQDNYKEEPPECGYPEHVSKDNKRPTKKKSPTVLIRPNEK
jgi:hypothetical protein